MYIFKTHTRYSGALPGLKHAPGLVIFILIPVSNHIQSDVCERQYVWDVRGLKGVGVRLTVSSTYKFSWKDRRACLAFRPPRLCAASTSAPPGEGSRLQRCSSRATGPSSSTGSHSYPHPNVRPNGYTNACYRDHRLAEYQQRASCKLK